MFSRAGTAHRPVQGLTRRHDKTHQNANRSHGRSRQPGQLDDIEKLKDGYARNFSLHTDVLVDDGRGGQVYWLRRTSGWARGCSAARQDVTTITQSMWRSVNLAEFCSSVVPG
jgi:hypothetical protein